MRNQLKTLSRQLFTQKHFICFQKQFLFSFNTVQYPHTLENNIYYSCERGPSPFFHTDSNPILDQFLVHSVDKTNALVVTVELIWLLLLNILSFNFFLRLPVAVLSKQWQSYTAFLLEVATFLFFQLFLPIIVHLFAYSISVPQILLTPRWVSRQKDVK